MDRQAIQLGGERRDFWARWLHVWLPIVVALPLAVPFLGYMLPAATDANGEIYQPLRSLKFAASMGQDYHKWGSVPNFVLLPAYLAQMAVWKVTGDFSSPSGDWPYGLARPVEQLGVLIFHGRLVALVVGLIGVGVFAAGLGRLVKSRVAVMLAVLLGVVGNYRVVYQLPVPSVDAFMVAFLLMTFGGALRMMADGVTVRRAALTAVAAAMALGSKENSGFVLLGVVFMLLIWCWFTSPEQPGGRRAWGRGVAAAFVAGLGTYLLTSVALSPSVWRQRMAHWLGGSGVDADVWQANPTAGFYARQIGGAFLDNLGPAGVVAIPALVALAFATRRWWRPAALLLPAATGFAGILSVGYTPDRFATPTCLALVPLAAVGADRLRRLGLPVRRAALAVGVLAVAVNVWWCGVVYHLRDITPQAMFEREVAAVPADVPIGYVKPWPNHPYLRRLEATGRATDQRAQQDWTAADAPPVAATDSGWMQMIDESARMPARRRMFEADYGFDVTAWPGMAALGYGTPVRVRREFPAWLPFRWMPIQKQLQHQDVLIYRKAGAAGTARQTAPGG